MVTEAPRSGGTEKFQGRLPKFLLDKIDRIIEEGEYASRSEYIRHLVEQDFAQKEAVVSLDSIVEERIREGRYDEALKKRMSEILSSHLMK